VPHLGLDTESHSLRLEKLVLPAAGGPREGVVTAVRSAEGQSIQARGRGEAGSQLRSREEAGAWYPYVFEEVDLHCQLSANPPPRVAWAAVEAVKTTYAGCHPC
jgi:hypothetical protein